MSSLSSLKSVECTIVNGHKALSTYLKKVPGSNFYSNSNFLLVSNIIIDFESLIITKSNFLNTK